MSAELSLLRREIRRQRTWIVRLAKALYKHARTDVAPDAALPSLEKLIRDTRPARPRRQ